MSENIIIQEGGVGKNLNAIKKIQTADQGGGSVYWIPEEEIELGTKTITKNGLYKASKSGVDGWSQVLVNVPGGESKTDSDGDLTDEDGNKARVDSDGNPTSDSSGNPVKPKPSDNGGNGTGVTGTNGVSGINPNDGNEYHVTKNPNTGELIYTKIPSSIKVTKSPDKTSYQDGETINPSGIIVHGYFADGTDYGTILNSELRFDPIIADIGGQGGGGHGTGTYHIFTEPTLVYISNQPFGDPPVRVWLQGSADMRFVFKNTLISFISKDLNAWAKVGITSQDGVIPSMNYWGSKIIEYSGTQYTVCSMPNGWGFYNPDAYYVGQLPSDAQISANEYDDLVKYTYGSSAVPEGSIVTVKWNRPTDEKELTDTFYINVSPSGGGGSHGF